MDNFKGGEKGDEFVVGPALTWLHEYKHTKLGGGLTDPDYKVDDIYTKGEVVTFMNKIESELNLPQRAIYTEIPVTGKYHYHVLYFTVAGKSTGLEGYKKAKAEEVLTGPRVQVLTTDCEHIKK